MDARELKAAQAPLKERYREDPPSALVTLRAEGTLGKEDVSCSVATGRALVEAGLHPATGGTGSLAVQLAKRAGAKVIGLASSDEKRALVEQLGADATADSRAEDLKAAILEANGGEKVDVVLHMSGTGFEAELSALNMLGRIVVFGNAARHPSNRTRSFFRFGGS